MATNTEHTEREVIVERDGSSHGGAIAAILAVVAILVLIAVFAFGAFDSDGGDDGGINVDVPEQIDINTDGGSGGEGGQ